MKCVDGPLLDVVASRVAICPICASGLFGRRPKSIRLILDSPKGTIPLTKDSRGTDRAAFLLDPAVTKSFTFHFDVDGKKKRAITHQISAVQEADGVVPIKGDITGCFFNRFLLSLRRLFDQND